MGPRGPSGWGRRFRPYYELGSRACSRSAAEGAEKHGPDGPHSSRLLRRPRSSPPLWLSPGGADLYRCRFPFGLAVNSSGFPVESDVFADPSSTRRNRTYSTPHLCLRVKTSIEIRHADKKSADSQLRAHRSALLALWPSGPVCDNRGDVRASPKPQGVGERVPDQR